MKRLITRTQLPGSLSSGGVNRHKWMLQAALNADHHPRALSNSMFTGHNKRPLSVAGTASGVATTIFSNFTSFRDWHHPSFLMGENIAAHEDWLNRLIDTTPELVDTEAYLVVLRAFVNSSENDAPIRAERWLQRLEAKVVDQVQQDQVQQVKLTPECYECVVRVWGQSQTEDSCIVVARAERWFRKHLNSDDRSVRPDTATCNAFLHVCSRGRAFKRGNDNRRERVREHAMKSQQVLQFMIQRRTMEGEKCSMAPDTNSFNFVIRAWTRCRLSHDIVERAVDVLKMMENYSKDFSLESGPNVRSYAMVMDAISVRAKQKVKRLSNSDTRQQTNSATNGLDEIRMLNEIVAYMQSRSAAGTTALAPTTAVFNTLMNCWSQLASIHEHAPNENEKILQHMVRMKDGGNTALAPDCSSYMMIMRAWFNSQHPNRAERVAWWLSKQWQDYEFEGDKSIRPNAECYNILMRTWAQLGKPEKAQDALAEMVTLCEKHNAVELSPTSESYSSVIRAWLCLASYEGSIDALERGVHWFMCLADCESDEDKNLVAPVEYYHLILASARKCAAQYPETLDLVKRVMNYLSGSHHSVDALHYSRYLQVGLQALSRPEKDHERRLFLQEVIEHCIQDGVISKPFLTTISKGPIYADGWTRKESTRTLQQYFQVWPLPPDWTRNVSQDGLKPDFQDLQRNRRRSLSRHGVDPFQRHGLKDSTRTKLAQK